MKKYLQLLLALCLSFSLFACTKEESKENPETQAKFEDYLDELFKEEMEADFLTYHYTLLDPEAMGIEKPEVSWGSLTRESNKENIEDCKEELEKLHGFEKSELNAEQQKIYRLLEIKLENSIEAEKYLDFEFCFGENKVNDNLITNLTEYRISTQEDVEDYIVLLKDVDRYISEGIEATKQMADEGHIQKEIEKDTIVEQCEKFLDSEEIEKHLSSEMLKIDELSEAQKADYESQAAIAVKDYVKPAYQKIIDLYDELPVAENQGSLAEVENGKEYLEYLLKVNIGKERKVEDWIEICEKEVKETITQWITILITSTTIEEELENVELPADDAEGLVKYLEKCLEKEFPSIGQVQYHVSYLDESVANDLVSAYYVIPPIDAPELNTIKVNPKNTDLVDLFSTLAHEGFPGHLYQNNYVVQKKGNNIYYLLDNLGSSEGWAEYVGMDAYRLANIGSEEFQEYMSLYHQLNRMLNEYVNLQVNYNGWKTDDIADYLDSLGLISDIAEDLYDDAVLRPAVYSPYSLGTYEVLSLREKAEKELGNKFDVLSFNQALLDAGTVHFDIVEEAIDDYISNNK